MMRRGFSAGVFLVAMVWWAAWGLAQEESVHERVHDIGEIEVTAERIKHEFTFMPNETVLDLDEYQPMEVPQNIGDYIKDMIIFDFRNESNLVPDDDSFQMRGFEANRFVTSIDGLNLRKTGGRKSSHIVDYAYLPPFLIEKIEVLPGPHSALYPAKSIGGVLNLITRDPKILEDLKPNLTMSSNYKSYNTQNHSVVAQGSVCAFTYDVGYQKYSTDGYLRNNEADIDTIFSRIGYVLPTGGHVAFSAGYADADRRIPVFNDASLRGSGYDDNHPKISDSLFYSSQDPSWDGIFQAYRFNYRQPTIIGNLSVDSYYSEETRDRAYFNLRNSSRPWLGVVGPKVHSFTLFTQHGTKVQDEFVFSDQHKTTLELDYEQCYDGSEKDEVDKRIEIFGTGLQHEWKILPRLTLRAGLRFEDVDIHVGNVTGTSLYISGEDEWINRSWNDWQPKSFLTYELDDVAPWLRDTSLSLAVSRIWRAPDYHGDYNPQGRPAGAWLDPEHGVGMDLVFMRRLFGDVRMRVNYSVYDIEDFIATNSTFANFTPSRTNPVPRGQEYKDYKINLKEVVRQGVEVELSGHIIEPLSFYLGYAFQDFNSLGDEPAGETEADDRAKHRVNAGLRYNLFKNTMLLLDYQFQDEQVILRAEELANDQWVFFEEPIDAYQLVDFGIQQTLFKTWGPFRDGVLKLYVNNVFDEDYQDTNGYPGTDRTFGIGLRFRM